MRDATLVRLIICQLVVVTSFYAWAAPAPPKKIQPARNPVAADVVGEWNILWGTCKATMTFQENGDYLSTWGSHDKWEPVNYRGAWGIDFESGKLWIIEAHFPNEGPVYHKYEMTLDYRTGKGLQREVPLIQVDQIWEEKKFSDFALVNRRKK
jgi:hypothetical protein